MIETEDYSSVKILSHPYSCQIGTGRGIDAYCVFIIGGLSKMGFEKVELIPSGVKSFNSISVLKAEVGFLNRVRRLNGRVFHFLSPVGAKTAAFVRKKQFIVTINDVIPFFVKGFHPLRYFALRWFISLSAKHASKVIVPFDFTKKFLADKMKIPESRIEVVNYWLDEMELDPYPKVESGENKKKYLIFFGSHNAIIRGGDIAVTAFARLLKIHPDVILKLVVKMNSRDTIKLKRLVSRLSISSSVQFIDFLIEKEMNREISNASAVLYPSRLGYGYLFTKGIRLGKPVISTSSLDMNDFLDKYDGLCPENDIDCIVEKISRVLTDPEFCKKLASQGSEILKLFDSNRAIEKMISIYNQYK